MTAAATPIVEMRKISKSFGAVRALHEVDLRLMPGEVLGLVGDNSARKSPLLKILTGAYQRAVGEVLVGRRPTRFRAPPASRHDGIQMISPELSPPGHHN